MLKKIMNLLVLLFILTINGNYISLADDSIFDLANISNGGFLVLYDRIPETKYKVVVISGDSQYTYDLNHDTESFSLTEGEGVYVIGLYEHVQEGQYMLVERTSVYNEADDIGPFLLSVQQVNYGRSKMLSEISHELVSDDMSDMDKLSAIYDYISLNITYDEVKAQTVRKGYLPNVDDILTTKEGMCFDYASLTASMLRYEGVPAKLVKGYRTGLDQYHAWTEVFIDGVWQIIDLTEDSRDVQLGETPEMFKNEDLYDSVKFY